MRLYTPTAHPLTRLLHPYRDGRVETHNLSVELPTCASFHSTHVPCRINRILSADYYATVSAASILEPWIAGTFGPSGWVRDRNERDRKLVYFTYIYEIIHLLLLMAEILHQLIW